MPKQSNITETSFDWKRYPQTGEFLDELLEGMMHKNPFVAELAEQMRERTSTRLKDWVDHFIIPAADVLVDLGYEPVDRPAPLDTTVWQHNKSVYPPVLVRAGKFEIAIKPELLNDFVKIWNIRRPIEGCDGAPYRSVVVYESANVILSAVERRGSAEFVCGPTYDIASYQKALFTFNHRQRTYDTDQNEMEYIEALVDHILETLSPRRAADAFFRAERAYWMSRNAAGRLQKARQDSVGLGWGNQDHLTYRSSREHYAHLIRIFEKLGFACRERFYASEEAGWGAQVLEHPECDIVLFCDVDMTDEDRGRDFAHQALEKTEQLGSIGLWVGLHGESILQAGLHHLEARFDFEQLHEDLAKEQMYHMEPFSNFPYLKQAFTVGEQWKVSKDRLDALRLQGLVTEEQYDQFSRYGAKGSHLENLERNDGFKGFNKGAVSFTIKATDPRKR